MDRYEIRRLALINVMNDRFDGKQARLAEAVGKRRDYLSRVINKNANNKRIGDVVAREIEDKLGLPTMWMDHQTSAKTAASVPTVKGPVVSIEVLEHKSHDCDENFTGFPVYYRDIEATRRKLENMRVATVADTGMAFTLGARNYVAIVDISSTTPTDGDVYMIDHGNRLKLRRMRLTGDRWIACADRSADDRYADIEITDPETMIVGQVIWGGGFLI